MDKGELAACVNEQQGTAFRVVGSLGGGFQEGAYRIEAPDGRAAVLKATDASRSVPVIRRLRAVGYPAPDVLFQGTAPDGTFYHVQEFLSGEPLPKLTQDYTRQLIDLNRLQADRFPPGKEIIAPIGDWSRYAVDVVYANESGWAERLHDHSSETALLMRDLERAAAPYADTVLPWTDAVHGDWSVGNLLAVDGKITGIVDCGAAGIGTRAIDLASLLHYAYGDEYDNLDGQSLREVLRWEILAIGQIPLLVILLVYRAMAIVEFRARTPGKAAGVDAAIRMGRRILADPNVFSA